MNTISKSLPKLEKMPPALDPYGLTLESPIRELFNAMQNDGQRVLATSLTNYIFEHAKTPLGNLLPILRKKNTLKLKGYIRSRRGIAALNRFQVVTWKDLANLSAENILTIIDIGEATCLDILATAIEVAVALDSEPQDLADDALNSGKGRSNKLKIDHTLSKSLEPSLTSLIDKLLDLLNPREKEILVLRIINESPLTLQHFGDKYRISRERVRQLEEIVINTITNALDSHEFRPLSKCAQDLRKRLGVYVPMTSLRDEYFLGLSILDASGDFSKLFRFLLWLAGPYRAYSGWLILVGEPKIDSKMLHSLANEFGVIDPLKAKTWLSKLGVKPAFQNIWIDQFGKIRRLKGKLIISNVSLESKCVSVISIYGRPMSSAELANIIGPEVNVRTLRNQLPQDTRIVRVGRTDWGLKVWGFGKYDGIMREIEKHIEIGGGEARVRDIAEEIAQKFNVRPQSIYSLATAPQFIRENGQVRFRKSNEPYEIKGTVSSCPGVFTISSNKVSILINLDSECMRGSGRRCPPEFARAIGVSPGNPKSWRWADGRINVTWSMNSASGPGLGSIRSIAIFAGGNLGDLLRLDFDVSNNRLSFELVPKDVEKLAILEALRFLTGLKINNSSKIITRLSSAISVEPSMVINCLHDRGDHVIANLLSNYVI